MNLSYQIRLVKYSVIILLCGLGVGYAVFRYLPTWVFVVFVLVNLMAYAVVRGGSRRTDRHEDE
ncbi:hypothetical protein [Hymenobacter arizonensis]|uniref:hypothetical protein n=1 Tax=Hymenobacter arizonensis TaxID=1227077 RepID=UPI001160773B|nr:hypothetical protein [Hymenobacter arizonensis]